MAIDPRKKYSVGGSGAGHAYASTLSEARRRGEQIAKKEAWRGRWNVLYIAVSIRKATGVLSYGKPLLTMYVPVRGSGATAAKITEAIKTRHGVKPFVWTRRS